MKYHVTYKRRKKIITAENRNALDSQIRKSFAIYGSYHIQYYDNEFQDYVDTDDLELPCGNKLILLDSEDQNISSIPDTDTLLVEDKDQDDIDTSCDMMNVGDGIEHERSFDAPLNSTSLSVANNGNGAMTNKLDWLLTYELPNFPVFVVEAISDISDTNPIPDDIRRKIVNIVYQSIVGTTLYPDQGYQHVCSMLVRKYPQLRDKSYAGSPYSSWKYSLKNKFKELRRPMTGNTDVKAKKAKFGQNKKGAKANHSSDTDQASEPDDLWSQLCNTYEERQKMIADATTTKELFSTYPGLHKYKYMSMEVSRKCNQPNNFLDSFSIVATKMTGSQHFKNKEKTDRELSEILLSVNDVFQEENYFFEEESDGDGIAYPHIILKDGDLAVVCEQHTAFEAPSAEEAVVYMMLMYWELNIQFPKKLNKTLSFFAILCKLPKKTVPIHVRKILNTLL